MNQSDYLNMVVMLRTATLKKKIHWEENNGDFSTKVGGCLIELISSYDFQVGISSYSLRLYNTENVLFETISYSEDVDNENVLKADGTWGEGGGGGGSSTFADLDDVELTNPSGGDIPIYDSEDQKWN